MTVQPPLIAVTGVGGMLGRDVVEELGQQGLAVAALTRGELDVTDAEMCAQVLGRLKPASVIHCAAYTDVNRAESEPDLAMRVNGTGAGNVARAASDVGSRFILVSTDYVFDGTSAASYPEDAPVAPLNSYGRSKLEGERQAQNAAGELCVVARTSWLYGRSGTNFVTTMLAAARAGKPLKVVNDQIGAPTYTRDLSRALVDLTDTKIAPRGIYHVTNGGSCSWFEFAEAIFGLSRVQPTALEPVPSSAFSTPATRPANSPLRSNRLEQLGIEPLRHWRDALLSFLAEIGELPR